MGGPYCTVSRFFLNEKGFNLNKKFRAKFWGKFLISYEIFSAIFGIVADFKSKESILLEERKRLFRSRDYFNYFQILVILYENEKLYLLHTFLSSCSQ